MPKMSSTIRGVVWSFPLPMMFPSQMRKMSLALVVVVERCERVNHPPQ